MGPESRLSGFPKYAVALIFFYDTPFIWLRWFNFSIYFFSEVIKFKASFEY